ncbi:MULTISPECIES: Lrp/AsnC family transcriptional regulator [unclassified Rhizobium]|uniref:Lrp/AsnC family transcriptional regulator n=1 Tax=unclassified Rhizobium TaxID=2613769 RepID=UPI0006467BB4|nr:MULTISPECIES: Lrp/AsnC family transcriptional regulator [unclassified Rhizobium]MBN8952618.1 Lrp/AsnC family transcriptional regulator [Rhizobium tropici]OJY64519.1 MAG: AsnC family transcriptional regulator [Rhizobium sp. 60-20]
MDETDRKILAELQRDGRQSLTELGERVGISLSPAHRRVRAMEDAGIITGYRAVVEPSAVGLGFAAVIFVTLAKTDSESVAAFEKAVPRLPEVVQAVRLFGDPDFMLHVVTVDLPAFQQFYDERLSKLPSVQRLTSTLVMKTVVPSRSLPL